MVSVARWPERDDSDMGQAYRIDGYIRLDQFDFELSQVLGVSGIGISVDGDLEAASQFNPCLMYIHRADVPPSKVVAVAADHVPSQDWFATVTPTRISVSDVARKAASGGVLTPEEIQVALAALLAKANL